MTPKRAPLFILLTLVPMILAAHPSAAKPENEVRKPDNLPAGAAGDAPSGGVKVAAGPVPVSGPAMVTAIELERLADALLLRIATSKPVRSQLGKLSNPARLFIDLLDARISRTLRTIPVGDYGVARVRVGQYTDSTARVVLDISSGVKARVVGGEPGAVLVRIEPPPSLRPKASPSPGPTSSAPGEGDGQGSGEGLPVPAVPVSPQTATISSITSEETEFGTRVKIRTDRPIRPRTLSLDNPKRLVLDFSGVVLAMGETEIPVTSSLITAIRTGQPTAGSPPQARIVLDLAGSVSHNISFAVDELWVDLRSARARNLPKSLVGARIAIDPGHGGDQPGAMGVSGTREKTVNLAIALRLSELLQAAGAVPILTRSSDQTLGLDERVLLSEGQGADLFISIHCNSCGVPNTKHGTELYYYTPQSRDLAGILQKKLVAALGTKNGGVFQRRFVVIRKTQIPAVLVEVAYINHSSEEAKLKDPSFQERAAKAIVEGLREFLEGASAGRMEPLPVEPVPSDSVEEGPSQDEPD